MQSMVAKRVDADADQQEQIDARKDDLVALEGNWRASDCRRQHADSCQ
jgi:hypothetical protein